MAKKRQKTVKATLGKASLNNALNKVTFPVSIPIGEFRDDHDAAHWLCRKSLDVTFKADPDLYEDLAPLSGRVDTHSLKLDTDTAGTRMKFDVDVEANDADLGRLVRLSNAEGKLVMKHNGAATTVVEEGDEEGDEEDDTEEIEDDPNQTTIDDHLKLAN